MKKPIQVFNYSFVNKSSDEVDVFIDGQIVDASTQEIYKAWFGDDSSVSFKSFRNVLNSSEAKTFNIYINSPGGLVTDAMAMHDYLTQLETKGKTVNRIGMGVIASAATFLLVGKNSTMSKNSWMMIHNVSGAVYGDVNEIEKQAGIMRQFNDNVRDFYVNTTGKRKEDVTKMMNAETWMTADEAKENGFIKNVTGDATFKNAIAKEDWQFNNTAVLNFYNSAVKQPPQNSNTEEMKKLFNEWATTIVNAIKGVKPAENNDQQALINSIADSMKKPFEDMGVTMEIAITDSQKGAFTNALASDEGKLAIKNAVDAAVLAATKPLSDKITGLETKNTDLETEIGTLKGKAADPKDDKRTAQIGNFTKAKAS